MKSYAPLRARFGVRFAISVIAVVLASGSADADSRTAGHMYTGLASWYGGKFHGRKTANGEIFDMNKLTAAHKSLPFGTKVKVTNRRNGKSVVVRINDRGPYSGKRVIDLSKKAASAVGILNSGVAPVKIEVLGK